MTGTLADAELAVQAWAAGDHRTAIEAADRALATGVDPLGRAAGVAAAAAAADAALADATARWRRLAETSADTAGVEARGRAALNAALTGRPAEAAADLAMARDAVADHAPRGLTVLLGGVDALLGAVHGDLTPAADVLVGLAGTTVPPDPFALESWPELAATAAAANGDAGTARAVLATQGATVRAQLLSAWLAMQTGRHTTARSELGEVADRPVLRRNGVLAAAVTVGLVRRAGDARALGSTWRRVAPVIAGADLELLQIDLWGEFSVAAAAVAPATAASIAAAMDVTITRAGSPAWAVAAGAWWAVQRAAAGADATAMAGPVPAVDHASSPYLDAIGAGTRTWASVLTGQVDAQQVLPAVTGLVDAGRPWEAATLAATAAARAADAAVARQLLSAVRGLRGRSATHHGSDGLSVREREIGRLLLDGHTQREIGAKLYLSPKTVQQHVTRLRQKLMADNRAELVSALRTRWAAGAEGPR